MYISPHTWIAAMGLAWGATMTLSGLVQNLSGALAVRFFLGGKTISLLQGRICAHESH